MNLFGLREYQEDAVTQIEQAWQSGIKSTCYQLPTGGGKSRILRTIIDNRYPSGKTIYTIAHRSNLTRQLSNELSEADIKHGMIKAGFPHLRYPTQVCSVQTLVRRLQKLPEPEILIFDEAHHCQANTFRKIIDRWPKARILGVTATPGRTDKKPLGDIFQKLISGPSMSWLIQQGFLSDYEYLAPETVSMDGVHQRMGEYIQSEVLARVDKRQIIGSAVDHYRQHSDHLPAIVACVSIKHAEHVAKEFCESGYRFRAIHSKMDDSEIVRAMRELGDGTIDGLTNCDLISEGIDIPIVTTLIGLRPTMSLIIFLQYCGRVLRPHPGKEKAIILDHVGNFERHGLPDDEREWSLNGVMKDDKGKSSYKRCPDCFHPVPVSVKVCQYCGHEFASQERNIIPEQKEGILVNVRDRRERQDLIIQIARGAANLKQAVKIARDNGIKHTEAFYIWTKVLKNKPETIVDIKRNLC